jgi:hypothetical protein
MKASTRTIEFTAAERAEIKLRMRKSDEVIARLAATATLEEQERLAKQLCPQHDAWIRGRNRVQRASARRGATIAPRPRPVATPRERRDASSSRTSGQDPGGDPDPDDGPWALSFVDRAPFLWRVRAFRCRLLEIRGGVDR